MSTDSFFQPWHSLAWRSTHPPMAGGSPEGDENPSDPAVDEPAELVEHDAPDTGTSVTEGDDPAAELGASFKLADVPEEYRDHVARYAKQVQGAYTRKTQELAEQRKTFEGIAPEQLDVARRLGSEDTRESALRELLLAEGWDIEEADEAAEAEVDPGAQQPFELPPEIQAKLDAVDQLTAREQARDTETYHSRVGQMIDESLKDFAKANDLKDVPEHARRAVMGYLAQLPPVALDGEDGEAQWPDTERAIALYEEQRAADIQSYLDSKRVPGVDASGVAGQPKFNPRDDKERLAAANAIAARHI